jgi:transglutaminase/protease-like cytokinesis protein 3
MVRLEDDEWYCVDVTWDDTEPLRNPEDGPINHKYFNVTSDFLRYNDHQWNESRVPKATSEKYM